MQEVSAREVGPWGCPNAARTSAKCRCQNGAEQPRAEATRLTRRHRKVERGLSVAVGKPGAASLQRRIRRDRAMIAQIVVFLLSHALLFAALALLWLTLWRMLLSKQPLIREVLALDQSPRPARPALGRPA